jgi:glycerophosphoryl diester phosphodiesterase
MVLKKSISTTFLLLFSVLCFYACKEDDDIKSGEVSISLSNSFPARGEVVTIKLHNMPTKFSDLNFDFGDGTTSSDVLNYKSYEKDGTYKIKTNFVDNSGKEIVCESSLKVEGIGLTEKLNELKQNNKIWVMAHRGTTSNRTIPENSIAAIQACIKAGVDVFEFDTM